MNNINLLVGKMCMPKKLVKSSIEAGMDMSNVAFMSKEELYRIDADGVKTILAAVPDGVTIGLFSDPVNIGGLAYIDEVAGPTLCINIALCLAPGYNDKELVGIVQHELCHYNQLKEGRMTLGSDQLTFDGVGYTHFSPMEDIERYLLLPYEVEAFKDQAKALGVTAVRLIEAICKNGKIALTDALRLAYQETEVSTTQ